MKKLFFALWASTALAGGNSLYQLGSRWTDTDGKTLSLDAFAGKAVVLAMVYTSCQSSCPATVADLHRMEKALDAATKQKTEFVLVSFDPARDTPKQMQAFRERHELPQTGWSLLSGTEDGIRDLAAVLGVKFRKLPSGDYSHSNLIVVLDREGNVVHREPGLGANPAPAVAAIRAALR